MKMITTNTQITEHFNAFEFKCKCGCNAINIDEMFVQRIELLWQLLHKAVDCHVIIVNSGYRCAKHSQTIKGAFIGDMHNIGAGADIHALTNSGKAIDSMTICEAAQLCGFGGIAIIDDINAHIDDRQRGDINYTNKSWYGNEKTGESYFTFIGKSKNSKSLDSAFHGKTSAKQIKVTIEIDDHKYSGLLDGE